MGLGKIGLAAVKIYKAMGMKVLAYNRSENDKAKAYVEYGPKMKYLRNLI